MKLRDVINQTIRESLTKNNGNKAHTARDLGVSLRMIRYKAREFEREALMQATSSEQKEFLKRSFK